MSGDGTSGRGHFQPESFCFVSGDKVPPPVLEKVVQPLEVIGLGGVGGLGFSSLICGGCEQVVYFFKHAFCFPEFD